MLETSEAQATLAAARDGDRDALGDLYCRHADAMYNVALRLMGTPADAQDVVQDVFLTLPAALQKFEGRGAFQSWLAQVTVRAALMKLRRRRRRNETSLAVVPPARQWPAPDSTVLLTLERALDSLPDHLEIVVLLKEIAGYSHEEIAGLLGITPGASMVRLCRARHYLRAWSTGSGRRPRGLAPRTIAGRI